MTRFAIIVAIVSLASVASADSGQVKSPGLSFGSIAGKAKVCKVVETRNAKGQLKPKMICSNR